MFIGYLLVFNNFLSRLVNDTSATFSAVNIELRGKTLFVTLFFMLIIFRSEKNITIFNARDACGTDV